MKWNWITSTRKFMTTTIMTSQRFRMLDHLCWCNGNECPWKNGKHHACVYTFYGSKTEGGWSCIIITVEMVVVPNFSVDPNINWNKSFFLRFLRFFLNIGFHIWMISTIDLICHTFENIDFFPNTLNRTDFWFQLN